MHKLDISFLIGAVTTLCVALIRQPLTEFLRGKNSQHSTKQIHRREKILEWRGWVANMEYLYDQSMDFRRSSSYQSLKPFLTSESTEIATKLVLPFQNVGIEQVDRIAQRKIFFELMLDFQSQISSLESRWKLI